MLSNRIVAELRGFRFQVKDLGKFTGVTPNPDLCRDLIRQTARVLGVSEELIARNLTELLEGRISDTVKVFERLTKSVTQ